LEIVTYNTKEFEKALELINKNREKYKQEGSGTHLRFHKSGTWEIHFITH